MSTHKGFQPGVPMGDNGEILFTSQVAGLLRSDGSEKPSWTAYQEVI